MTIAARLFTAEDLEQMPDELRVELIRGELIPMPPLPGAEHGNLVMDLSLEVGYYVKQHRLGRCFTAETGFKIESEPDTVIGPDFAYVAKTRLPEQLPKGALSLAPDLVLEVRSPSDRAGAVVEKMQRWIEAGVKLAWELNPRRRILTVYRPGIEPHELTENDTVTGQEVLPGFTFALRTLFADEEE